MEIKKFKIPKKMTESFTQELIKEISDEIKKIKFEIVKIAKSNKIDEMLKSFYEVEIKKLESILDELSPKPKKVEKKSSKKTSKKSSKKIKEEPKEESFMDSVKDLLS